MLERVSSAASPETLKTPYLLEAVREGKGRLRIFKVDVDQVPEAASRYRIGSVPIVILFRDGVEVERSVGVEPERIRALAGLR
jgi:thioredoxin 1